MQIVFSTNVALKMAKKEQSEMCLETFKSYKKVPMFEQTKIRKAKMN